MKTQVPLLSMLQKKAPPTPPTSGMNRFEEKMALLARRSREWKKDFEGLLTSLEEAKKVTYPL
jgi:hypothetical protein